MTDLVAWGFKIIAGGILLDWLDSHQGWALLTIAGVGAIVLMWRHARGAGRITDLANLAVAAVLLLLAVVGAARVATDAFHAVLPARTERTITRQADRLQTDMERAQEHAP